MDDFEAKRQQEEKRHRTKDSLSSYLHYYADIIGAPLFFGMGLLLLCCVLVISFLFKFLQQDLSEGAKQLHRLEADAQKTGT